MYIMFMTGVGLSGVSVTVLALATYLEWKRKEPIYMLFVKGSLMIMGIGGALSISAAQFL